MAYHTLYRYLLASLLFVFCDAKSATYTMTAFTNQSESNMYVYESDNGTHFGLIKGPAFTPPAGLIRDPSVIHHSDGKYWVTYTTNWSANSIGFAYSEDRENWTFSHNHTIPVANLTESWAPEWFIDDDGSIHILVSLRTSADGHNFTPSIISSNSNDFKSWSYPVAMQGLSPNYIDTFVVKINDKYHAITKNETSKYLEYATADYLEGPWQFAGTDDWAGWSNWVEGPSLVQLDNGHWRIFFDCYGCNPQKYYYSDSDDQLQTWSTKQELPGGLSGFVRHLTILKEPTITSGDYTRIETFSKPGHYLGHKDFNVDISNQYINAQDSRWRIVPGLADSDGISFQSINFPNRYLRHYNYDAQLQEDDQSSVFAADATFYQRQGLGDSTWASYESYNQPGMYLLHRDNNVVVAAASTDQDELNATFALAMPASAPVQSSSSSFSTSSSSSSTFSSASSSSAGEDNTSGGAISLYFLYLLGLLSARNFVGRRADYLKNGIGHSMKKLCSMVIFSSAILLITGCGSDTETPSSSSSSSDVASSSSSSASSVPLTESLPPTPLAPVVVDPTVQYQTHEGFGTSLAWFANVIGGWPDQTRVGIADLLFDHQKGLGLNVVRYNIGGGENPSHDHMRTGGDVPGFQPTEGQWDWSADANQRWVLQAAKQRAGDTFVAEAFSNSPPYWMTYSQCAAGNDPGSENALISDRYDDFADYLATVAVYFSENWGIDFKTLEPVNEPEATWWRAYNGQEGAHFSAQAQAQIINELATALNAQNSQVSISAMDAAGVGAALENYAAYSTSTKQNMTQINTHGYHGTREEQNKLRNVAAQDNKILWMSESDGGGGDEPFAEFTHNPDDILPGLDLSKRIYTVMRDMQPAAWVFWQAVENWPNQIQINKNWGLILADMDGAGSSPSDYRTTKKYHVMAQYTKYIRPGDRMIYISDESTVAFFNAQNSRLVLVKTNHANNQLDFSVDLSRFNTLPEAATSIRTSALENYQALTDAQITDNVLSYTLAPRSVTTFVVNNVGFDHGHPIFGEFRLINKNSGKCLDLSNQSAVQQDCANVDSQKWTFAFAEPGVHTIRHSDTEWLAVEEDSMAPAAAIQLSGAEANWNLLDQGDGSFLIASATSQYVLDVNSASQNSGARCIQWHINGGENQKWELQKW